MKKTFFLCVALIALFSCSNEELVENETVINKLTEDKVNILSFSDETEFFNSVETIRKSDNNSIETRSGTIESNFHSLFDEYQQALDEADFYYQSEAGYEEFKAKYSSLYFPEYKDDFSVYLPVSDESVSKLLNSEGKVLIAGEEKDFRDVFSYDKIKELGLAIPFIDYPEVEIPVVNEPEISTRGIVLPPDFFPFDPLVDTTFTRVDEFVISVSGSDVKPFYNSDKKVKLWVKAYIHGGRTYPNLSSMAVEICFRKKGFLGVWYNGKSTSNSWYETISYYHERIPAGLTLTDDIPYKKKNRRALIHGESLPPSPFHTDISSSHDYGHTFDHYPGSHVIGLTTPEIIGVVYFTHQEFGDTRFGIRFKDRTINPSGRYSNTNPISRYPSGR